MRVDAFDFELPADRIALKPVRPRDAARLLHVQADGRWADRGVRDLAAVLKPGDVMVFNDTKVIMAALSGVRPARAAGGGGPAHIEVNLHKRMGESRWRAFARPAKRLRVGDGINFHPTLSAEVTAGFEGGEVELAFSKAGVELDAALEAAGAPPLPPYIVGKRAVDADDADDYQTIYAREAGSVAAPTAGLHFTPTVFDALDAAGIERVMVTLHVGAGTFLPVKSEDTAGHVMHAERWRVETEVADRINRAKAEGRRIIAVGTTALRTLESAGASGQVEPGEADTDLFITPGFAFQIADMLMTNFHLPRSTLFMLVSAFSGLDVMQAAYAHAIAARYRFYSYGDACLLERPLTPGAP